MKKVILATLFSALAALAQTTGGTAPANSNKSATPAPKATVKRHSKAKKNTTTSAVKPAAGKDAKTPASK